MGDDEYVLGFLGILVTALASADVRAAGIEAWGYCGVPGELSQISERAWSGV